MRSDIARRLLGVILGAGLAIAPLAVAQETKTEKTKAAKTETPATKAETPKAAPKSAKEPEPAKAKGRLPAQYGKLNLTDAQREKIYVIQGRFKDQIEQLEKQLKEVQAKEDAETEAVLTPEQKTQLDALLEAAKQKKAAAKTASE